MSIRHLLLVSVLAVAMLALPAAPASAGETISLDLAYAPSTIGPGSTTRATLTLTNNSPTPRENVGFDQTFGAEGEIRVQTPGSATTSCSQGVVTADPGSTVVSLSDAQLGGFESCIVQVDVTSGEPGTHTTVPTNPYWGDDLEFAQAPGGVDLVVDAGRPGVTKSFAPTSIVDRRGALPTYVQGDDIRLTILLDNSLNNEAEFSLGIVDRLPSGLVVADQPNPSTTCDEFGFGTFTASPGSTSVSLEQGAVAAESTCAIAVTVTAEGPVGDPNRTDPATGSSGDLGFAVASISVEARQFRKDVLNNPVAPGGVVAVEFTVDNTGGSFADGAFTDDVDAMLTDTTVTAPLPTDPCGQGSTASGLGTGLLEVTDMSVLSGESCSFTVFLQLPDMGEAPGDQLLNVTSDLTAMGTGEDGAGGRGEEAGPIVLPPAADVVEIGYVPEVTKSFSSDPVSAGDTVTLGFEVVNPDPNNGFTDVQLQDNLSAFLDGVIPNNVQPASEPCGPGSTFTITAPFTDTYVVGLSGGTLDPGGSCSFSVDLPVPTGTGAGTYTNVIDGFTANDGSRTVVGQSAPATLEVVAAPSLTLDVVEDFVLAGDPATIGLELTHEDTAPGAATGVGFTLDLGAALPGLAGTDGTVNDLCGPGNGSLSGTDVISVSGITLAPGETCSITLNAEVPAGADPGAYTVQTSEVSATVLGIPTTNLPALDTLNVPGIVVTKEFTDDPVVAGDTATLEFTLENVTPGSDFSGIFFTDDLDAALDGLEAVPPLPDTSACGGGSSLSGTSFLIFSGGSLNAGTNCSFAVTVQVPAATADGSYRNVTSSISYSGSGPLVAPPATDVLEVNSLLVELTKTFVGYPVRAGETIGLEFTLTNLDDTGSLTGIDFTDDLEAVTSGLVAQGLPADDVCGVGSQVSGTDTIALTNGTLPASGSCTFTVDVLVPATLTSGGSFLNTTSDVTATGDGLPVTGDPASDTLVVAGQLGFVKAFSGPTVAGGTVDLTFELSNDSPTDGADQLQFADDLDAQLTGLAVTGPLPDQPCGPASVLEATPVLNLTGGSLGADDSCTFSVTLRVPADAAPGTYPNQTSDLLSGGIPVAQPAVDDLVIVPPPTFDKRYVPDDIGQGDVTTVTYTIDNTVSVLDATNLDFSDQLLPGTSVADPANASTTCTGGTLTAGPGGQMIAYTGGTVPAGASCEVTVDVSGDVGGVYVDETGELTSSSGTSGTAIDTLVVGTPPTLDKAFADPATSVGQATTLVLEIDNSINGGAVDILDLTDNLPAGMQIAGTPNAATTCTGGTITAPAGGTTITYTGGTVGGATTCQVDVDVVGTATGSLVNTTEPLLTSKGTSPAASATLTVSATPTPPPPRRADLAITGEARPVVIAPGGTTRVTLEVENLGPNSSSGFVTYTVPDGVALDDVAGCVETSVGRCDLPLILSGESVEIHLTTTHPTSGTDTIQATVNGTDDPVPSNDTTAVDVVVRQLGSLAQSLIDAAIQTSQERFSGVGGFAGDSDVTAQAAHVVLARADVFADALAGSVLTGDAPLLFTGGTTLDPGTGNEIRRVLPSGGTVYLLGGTAALADEVEAAVQALGFQAVRLAGPSRIETALAVADEARSLYGGGSVGIARAFGTEGNETAAWADSVTGGGWAAATGIPIVLTPTASLHPAVADWVDANAPMQRVVLGGTAAISQAVATAVNATDRVAGDERAGTAVAIARELRGVEPEGSRSYLLINGFADDGWGYGLIAAGLSADTGAPVLVTNTDMAPPATEAEVTSCAEQPVSLRRMAPTVQLTDALLSALDALDSVSCDGTGGDPTQDGGAGSGSSDQDGPTP